MGSRQCHFPIPGERPDQDASLCSGNDKLAVKLHSVVTDNLTRDFRYISKRLVKDIVQQNEAKRSRSATSFTLGWRGFGIAHTRRDPDYRNLFDLVKRATEAVTDLTGTFAYPGTYVHCEVDIVAGYLKVLLGWKDKTHVEIAAMMTEYTDPAVGSVLIGLFGSMSNYTWRRPKADGLVAIPSDVAGLYEILDQSREPGDPELERERVGRESNVIPEDRADTVIRLLRNRFEGFPTQRLDMLMKVFYHVDDFSFGGDHFDRVLIGTPIWASTPASLPFRRAPDRA